MSIKGILEDGTGTGNKLKINDENRALTESVTHTSDQDAAERGNLFQIGTGPVSLTSANESAVLYLKNNEDADLEITTFTFSADAFQGGAVDAGAMFLARLYVKSTGITNEISPAPAIGNNNLGSSKTIDVDFSVGQEGSAVTSGTLAGTTYLPQSDFKRFPLYWVLPRGTSLTVTLQPASGNTSVNCNVFFDAYLDE